jgi:hypothetical protein
MDSRKKGSKEVKMEGKTGISRHGWKEGWMSVWVDGWICGWVWPHAACTLAQVHTDSLL